jgi:hypothetical protein
MTQFHDVFPDVPVQVEQKWWVNSWDDTHVTKIKPAK